MSQVDNILEHLVELRKSFITYYDLKPQVDESAQKVIKICVDNFNNIINNVNIISKNNDDQDGFFTTLQNKIKDLDKMINDIKVNNQRVVPYVDVSMLLIQISRFLQDEIFQIKNKEIAVRRDQTFKKIKETSVELDNKYKELELISSDYKHKEAQKIYENDSIRFKSLARRYEISFYTLILILFLYFLGLTIYIPEIDIFSIKIKFPNEIHGKLSTEFYIQKVSLLILSTTLLAFLLKRSFMYRKFADDAYRTSKELIALPRYMKDLPQEMQDKIHFDLAYKYFGNGIHHESYTGGENLMHENIKANTDFIKAVKDLTPKAEVPKAEAAKEDKAPKDAA